MSRGSYEYRAQTSPSRPCEQRPSAGKIAVIAEIVDHNRVCITSRVLDRLAAVLTFIF